MNTDLRALKKIIVECAYRAGEGHIPSALSILDLLWVLYDQILKVEKNNLSAQQSDSFILSKGHASLALYAVLAKKNFFPISELDNFAKYDSILGGHPDLNKVPGVLASTGSLGHGLPMAVGIAMAAKIKKISKKVYCLIGDGECNEGTIWESALLACHQKLSNLCCIVDFNHSTDRALDLGDLKEKFESFGWKVDEINGHNHQEIYESISSHDGSKPYAVIANTIKGHGISRMENEPAWHHRKPSEQEFCEIMEELS